MLGQTDDLQGLAIVASDSATDCAIGDVTEWIKRVSWSDQSVAVDLTRNALKQAPRYDRAVPLTREMEIALFKHHGRMAYWPDDATESKRVVPDRADA